MNRVGLDLSNLQGHPDTWPAQPWYPTYQAAEFIICQALEPPTGYPGHDFIDPETFMQGYTGAALRQAKADGKFVGVYVWLWNYFDTNGATEDDIWERLATIPASVSLDMRPWLDMEDTNADHGPPRQEDVETALRVMDKWATNRGLPLTGCYSGDWYLRGYMDAWFPPDRMYWQANYAAGAQPELLPARPIVQWTSTPVDQNVMLDSEIVTSPEEPPVPDPVNCDGLINGLAFVADDLGDQLLAEARRSSVRKTTVRLIVKEMQRVRLEQVGPRP